MRQHRRPALIAPENQGVECGKSGAMHVNLPKQQHDAVLELLAENPARASEVSPEQIPVLFAEIAARQAALSALQGALAARLAEATAAKSAEPADRLLSAADVAKALGVTCRWVQRRARRLPFARKLSDHAIRYSEAGLKRWLAHRHVSVP
jgi:hypothetical protein